LPDLELPRGLAGAFSKVGTAGYNGTIGRMATKRKERRMAALSSY